MANEQRLIDANELFEQIHLLSVTVTGLRSGKGVLSEYAKHYRESVLRIVDEAPTVDAIPMPCKMGDEVWGLRKTRYSLSPEKGIVHHMYFGDDMRLCICVKNVCRGEWEKNVFATYEEAEAALAKIGGGNEDGQLYQEG